MNDSKYLNHILNPVYHYTKNDLGHFFQFWNKELPLYQIYKSICKKTNWSYQAKDIPQRLISISVQDLKQINKGSS